jgi:hypothetical protein
MSKQIKCYNLWRSNEKANVNSPLPPSKKGGGGGFKHMDGGFDKNMWIDMIWKISPFPL